MGHRHWWVALVARARSRLGISRVDYDPTPSAWDYAFRARGPCWVRALTTDGAWIGGYYGNRSYASSFPHSRDLYLEVAYGMDEDGSFNDRVSADSGLYLRCDDIRLLEFIYPGTPAPTIRSRQNGIEEGRSDE